MVKKISLIIGIVFPIILNAQTSANNKPRNSKPGEVWVIKWDRSDNFDDGVVDYLKWDQNPTHVQTWTWDNLKNVNESTQSKTVKITARFDDLKADRKYTDPCTGVTENNKDLYFTSGMLKSKATGTYGYYEARIKGAPLFPGVCPAFWMYSTIDDNIVTAGEVRYSEVDFVEMTQRGDIIPDNYKLTDHNLHTILSNGQTGQAGRVWQRPNNPSYIAKQANEWKHNFDPRDDFHTYGCEVNENEIIWYVDDIEVGRKPNDYWHRPMNVALSLGMRDVYNKFACNGFVVPPRATLTPSVLAKFPVSMEIDYVRVWEKQTATTNQLIANETYTIESTDSNQRLISGIYGNHDAVMKNPANKNNQKWLFTHLGNNIYTIRNKGTNRFLEVPNSVCQNSTQVSTFSNASSTHQQWKVVQNGNGIYGLKPAHCLTHGLDRNNGTVDTNVQIYSFSNSNENQKWKIIIENIALKNDINTTKKEKNITLYPNPAKDIMIISGEENAENIAVIDLSGRKITVEKQKKENGISINISNLQPGVYMALIADDEKTTLLKFYKE